MRSQFSEVGSSIEQELRNRQAAGQSEKEATRPSEAAVFLESGILLFRRPTINSPEVRDARRAVRNRVR